MDRDRADRPTPDTWGPENAAPSTEDDVPAGTRPGSIFWATLSGVLVLTTMLMLTGELDSLARDFMRYFDAPGEPAGASSASAVTTSRATGAAFSFEELDIHPDVVFTPYTAGQLMSADNSTSNGRMIREFRNLLDLYTQRQAEDDNFTIRVVDNRTDELLELFELEADRRDYENLQPGEPWDWGRIDGKRRAMTRELVRKYAARGIPNHAVTVKWGRRNQVLEARAREEGLIEYEVRLARNLGMSLLVTEIGTVETFNEDRLVSPVGARSRYQMMPYVLRQNDIHHYRVATAAGNAIDVYEEWHPLLTMEPAFVTAAGYANAVGHEIPGVSAYHTGPGNIYSVYRMFLTAGIDLFTPESTVMDAYMWAVTTGYPTVSEQSSFKSYSRGYVATAYGSLRATESIPIDSAQTIRAERLQLRDGQQIFLSQMLRALEQSERALNWGPGTEEMSPYDRFRTLNGHFALPNGSSEGTGITPAVDVRLTASSQGVPVRFFLPLGASDVLAEAGFDVIDRDGTFRFTRETYGPPDPSEITVWDRQYAELVDDVARFGFTTENRARLSFLVERFERLAETRTSSYRDRQLRVIKTHQRIWQSNVFDKLASAVSAARGQQRFEPRPPSVLPMGGYDVGN